MVLVRIPFLTSFLLTLVVEETVGSGHSSRTRVEEPTLCTGRERGRRPGDGRQTTVASGFGPTLTSLVGRPPSPSRPDRNRDPLVHLLVRPVATASWVT